MRLCGQLIFGVAALGGDDIMETSRHARREVGEVAGALPQPLPLPAHTLPELVRVQPARCVSHVLGHVGDHEAPHVFNNVEIGALRWVGQRLDLRTGGLAAISLGKFMLTSIVWPECRDAFILVRHS